MWIAIRLFLAIVVLFRRQILAWNPRTPTGQINSVPYFQVLHYKPKTKIIDEFLIGIDLPTSVRFHFKSENEFDRFFTHVGLADEFQTGDSAFDRKVYIACDHPAMHRRLKQDKTLRNLIVDALNHGFTNIRGDGNRLWMERDSDREPTAEDLRLLGDLQSSLSKLAKAPEGLFDPFFTRVLFIETLIWSIGAYALGALVEPVFHTFSHVNPMNLMWLGLLIGFGLMLGIGVLVIALLRGSSQGHRVILESGIVLILSLPCAGPMLVSDLNRHLDQTTPELVSREITGKDLRKSSGKRKSTTYYLLFEGPGSIPDIPLPERMSVSGGLYYRAQTGGYLDCLVHRGALGLPWYDNLSVR